MSGDRHTARSRAMHRVVVHKVLADPAQTVGIARRRLALLGEESHTRCYVEEWRRWLDAPPADLSPAGRGR